MGNLVIRNATIIDGTGTDPQHGMAIVILGNRIEAIVPNERAEYPQDSVVLDAKGLFVLPGMIDAHVHITFACAPDPISNLKELQSLGTIRGVANARTMLQSGVTAIRDAGSPIYANIALRQAIESGMVEGPRVRACGYGLSMTGGHGDTFVASHVNVDSPGLVDGPDEVRRAARYNLKMGADHIKFVSASGGVMSAGTELGAPQFTVEEMRAGVDVAHKAGKKAMAHCHGAQGVKNAILAGVDSIEHGTLLDDEAIEMMVKNGTFLVPTLLAPVRIAEYAEAGGIPEYAVRKTKSVIEQHGISFRKALKAGVKIAMGTDAGTPFNKHAEVLSELPLMVRNGMTPMQAIVAATRMGAELLDLSDKVGTLEVGKLADLIVVNGDPLKEIELFNDQKRVVCVVKDGVVVKNNIMN